MQSLKEGDYKQLVQDLVREPETNLHLFNRGGGSNEMMVRHAAYADSLLSTNQVNLKVRTAVYVHFR